MLVWGCFVHAGLSCSYRAVVFRQGLSSLCRAVVFIQGLSCSCRAVMFIQGLSCSCRAVVFVQGCRVQAGLSCSSKAVKNVGLERKGDFQTVVAFNSQALRPGLPWL